jgi:hypothetical protein
MDEIGNAEPEYGCRAGIPPGSHPGLARATRDRSPSGYSVPMDADSKPWISFVMLADRPHYKGATYGDADARMLEDSMWSWTSTRGSHTYIPALQLQKPATARCGTCIYAPLRRFTRTMNSFLIHFLYIEDCLGSRPYLIISITNIVGIIIQIAKLQRQGWRKGHNLVRLAIKTPFT